MGRVQQEAGIEIKEICRVVNNERCKKMSEIKADKDELLINGCIKCESEEDYYMILDELYRDRREEIENENFD